MQRNGSKQNKKAVKMTTNGVCLHAAGAVAAAIVCYRIYGKAIVCYRIYGKAIVCYCVYGNANACQRMLTLVGVC